LHGGGGRREGKPGQQIVALPDALGVGADYGLTVMNQASPAAYRFALFILSTEGQGYWQSTLCVPGIVKWANET